MTELAVLDGRIGPANETGLPVTDGAVLHADGAFEVVRVHNGHPFALEEHLDRLTRSARDLRIDQVVDLEPVAREVDELLANRGSSFDGCLRVVLTSGGHRLLMTEPTPIWPDRARLVTIDHFPNQILQGIKSLSYAANMLASRLAKDRGGNEALLVTPGGKVLEAPTSSFFYVLDDGVLCTPPLEDQVLASITRGIILRRMGVRERSLTVDELHLVVEAFLASTTRDVQPVEAIDDRELDAPGPRTAEAARLLDYEIQQNRAP